MCIHNKPVGCLEACRSHPPITLVALHKTVAEAGQRAEVARLEAERAQLDRRIAELRSTL